mgnify:CR=1 FL=1
MVCCQDCSLPSAPWSKAARGPASVLGPCSGKGAWYSWGKVRSGVLRRGGCSGAQQGFQAVVKTLITVARISG